MNATQRRIREDLVGELSGEVRCDDVTVAIYASDASLYEVRPQAVVFPADSEDVRRVVRYAAENDLSVTPRGGGSGTAGGALGGGIILDFSKSMTAVSEVSGDTVRVEAGVVRDSLNRRLKREGMYFAPDPGTSAVTTVGGMVAVNGGGAHSVRVGATRDHVRDLDVVTADGRSVTFGREVVGRAFDTTGDDGDADDAVKARLVDRLASLLRDSAAVIDERQGGVRPESAGYFLRRILRDGDPRTLDVASLLVGSEGTLAVTTAATLHLTPLAKARGAMMIAFGTLEEAVAAASVFAEEEPAACDLLDRRLLALARDSRETYRRAIPSQSEAALLIDMYGRSQDEVRGRLDRIKRLADGLPSEPRVSWRAEDPDDVEMLWSLPQRVVPLLSKLPGTARPLPFVEDVVVPLERWAEFLPRAQRVFQRHNVTASLYAHTLVGQLHFRPFLPWPETSEDRDRIEAIARDLYGAVFECGGTFSGERGDGLSRTAFLRSRYGPLYRVFRDVKRLFDPGNVLNPGKIVSDDQRTTVRHLKTVPRGVAVPLQMNWPGDAFVSEVTACNGCGDCRRQDSGTRMCPLFRLENSEHAAPRSKADFWRSVLQREVGEDVFQSPELRQLGQLCFNCKQCRLDCPSHVDIPSLVTEAKAAAVAANGLKRSQWILSRAHSFGEIGCSVSPLANWAIGNGTARWVIEKTVGIARRRKLPKFARRPYLRTLRTTTFVASPQKRRAVYFVDHFANYHDTDIAAATVAVLRHNGVTVEVPPGQRASGMAMVSAGDLDAARPLAEANVRAIAPLLDDRTAVVCSEPAAALCLRDEYPRLLDNAEQPLVSRSVRELGRYLLDLHESGELRTDFAPVEAELTVHTPCHLKALGPSRPFAELLRLVPGVRVEEVEKGCSGMAGAFGLTRDHFGQSVAIGQELMEAVDGSAADAGCTECSSCRLQMLQGSSKPTIHPIKVLAAAYGLMPDVQKMFKRRVRRWTVS